MNGIATVSLVVDELTVAKTLLDRAIRVRTHSTPNNTPIEFFSCFHRGTDFYMKYYVNIQ